MARMSEEQWNDLKFKITIGVILAIIGGSVYAVGPGLSKFVDRARARKTEPWAPKWFYNVGRVYEITGREPKALEVYKEFYLLYSGDERQLPGIEVALEGYPHQDHYALVPTWASAYSEGSRPAWVGGENAKPHPLMAAVLMRLSRIAEDKRDYQEARVFYRMVLHNFPEGTPTYTEAKKAEKRDISRGF